MRQIVIEAETPDDSRTLFSLRVDETTIGEGLTSAQAQIAVGEILEEVTLVEQPIFLDLRPYIKERPSANNFWPLLLSWGFVGIPLLWVGLRHAGKCNETVRVANHALLRAWAASRLPRPSGR
jgi:hypothetical protein